MRETTHRALRLALASLLTVALLARLAIGMSTAELTVANFLSLFGVLSNTMAAIAMAMLAWRPTRSSSRRFSTFRGAVTVYMAVTGLMYAVLLTATGVDVGATEPWVDWSLHILAPVAIVTDWAIDPPDVELAPSALGIWLAFPAAYLGYTLARGAIVGWYPYPFLDPRSADGYAAVAMWSSVALAVLLGLGYACMSWANWRLRAPVTA